MYFLFEERTKAYMQYVEGAPDKKNAYDTKKPAESRALHENRVAGANVHLPLRHSS